MKTFAEALCQREGCAREQFVTEALKQCVYPHAAVFARLFRLRRPAADLELLELAGEAHTDDQLKELLRDYWYWLNVHGNFAARYLKVRVSGQRLRKLFARVMRE